ncbi:HAD family hydrolase [Candidatus Aenigmatarchaeota archaeon]
MIKCIIFDIGGVVMNDTLPHLNKVAAEYYGVSIDKLKDVAIKNRGRMCLFEWNEDELWKGVSKDLGSSRPIKRFWEEVYEEIASIIPEIIEIIRKLKTNGYTLAILSNTMSHHVRINRERGAYNLFDIIVLSCDKDVNLRKPDIKIYELCLKRIGIPAEECVFIDDLKENLPPAEQLGISTILFKSPGQLEEDLKKLGVNL